MIKHTYKCSLCKFLRPRAPARGLRKHLKYLKGGRIWFRPFDGPEWPSAPQLDHTSGYELTLPTISLKST